jgi:hypothetical protein
MEKLVIHNSEGFEETSLQVKAPMAQLLCSPDKMGELEC